MTTETPEDISVRLRMESLLSRDGVPALLDKAADEIERLSAQVAQYREDAERLQWLHDNHHHDGYGSWLPDICIAEGMEREPTIDDTRAAIDKARKAEPPKDGGAG